MLIKTFKNAYLCYLSCNITEKKLGEYSKKVTMKPKPLSVLKSLEEKYVAVMKKLQFGK